MKKQTNKLEVLENNFIEARINNTDIQKAKTKYCKHLFSLEPEQIEEAFEEFKAKKENAENYELFVAVMKEYKTYISDNGFLNDSFLDTRNYIDNVKEVKGNEAIKYIASNTNSYFLSNSKISKYLLNDPINLNACLSASIYSRTTEAKDFLKDFIYEEDMDTLIDYVDGIVNFIDTQQLEYYRGSGGRELKELVFELYNQPKNDADGYTITNSVVLLSPKVFEKIEPILSLSESMEIFVDCLNYKNKYNLNFLQENHIQRTSEVSDFILENTKNYFGLSLSDTVSHLLNKGGLFDKSIIDLKDKLEAMEVDIRELDLTTEEIKKLLPEEHTNAYTR